MRQLKYLSPTSINSFRKDPRKFYCDYLADQRSARDPQNQAMSVGSAFDAYVKSRLVKDLLGDDSGKFSLETLLATQVSSENREWARTAGAVCMAAYLNSGAYADLILEMNRSSRAPRFEFTAHETIEGEGILDIVGGVPLLGKPDCDFIDSAGNAVVLDWKVNGYCSRSGHSPMAGYSLCRDGNYVRMGVDSSRSNGKSHTDYVRSTERGVGFNTRSYLEDTNPEWAVQLACYGWLGGHKVGSHFIVAIDQLACDASKGTLEPLIRVASHRTRVSSNFQEELFRSIVSIWSVIQSGWIFRDLSEVDSHRLQEIMDRGVVMDEDTAFLTANNGYKW